MDFTTKPQTLDVECWGPAGGRPPLELCRNRLFKKICLMGRVGLDHVIEHKILDAEIVHLESSSFKDINHIFRFSLDLE